MHIENMSNLHQRFQQFLKINLTAKDSVCGGAFYELYNDFAKLKWNKDNTLLKNPDEIPNKAKQFLRIVEESENKTLKWFVVNRQVGLSDSNFQRAYNLYKTRYLYVSVLESKTDLGVLEYLYRMNKNQLQLRVPRPKPIISLHTARLMRQMYLLKRQKKTKYVVESDTEQLKGILKSWFQENYTLSGEGIGYARRQLLEEANDFLVERFGDSKLVYCHDPAWAWLMQEVIGMDDKGQKGMYLRLPIWKKGSDGKAILNIRKSIGTGGEYTLEKRQHKRLNQRNASAREKDAARKARAKKKRKLTEEL
ncbi:MAG: hypothetical protein CMO44_17935 [Verrucomicrobiales bacterium]|nr:hypothetical protein [Verrucomicrobiales bacterium]